MGRASQTLRKGGVARPLRRARRPMSTPSRSLLAGRAAGMRVAPTTTEALLWNELRGSRLGVAFRRQVVIGRRIADFCAPSVKLVVEVDGGYHAGRPVRGRRRGRVTRSWRWFLARVASGELRGQSARPRIAYVHCAIRDETPHGAQAK